MDERIIDLYRLPNISEYEDIHLMTLREDCAVLEEQIFAIANKLPLKDQQVIQEYINSRNDLEVESIKTALRWGKRHYQQQENKIALQHPKETGIFAKPGRLMK